jgi:hypothetical protein
VIVFCLLTPCLFFVLFWKLHVFEEKEARLSLYCISVCLPTPENISSGSLVLRTNTIDYYTLTTCNYKGYPIVRVDALTSSTQKLKLLGEGRQFTYTCIHQVPRSIESRNIFFLEQRRRVACHFTKKGNLTNVRTRINLPNIPYLL